MKIISAFFKKVVSAVYLVTVLTFALLAGCAYITPAPVPPLADELGFEILNYKGVTTVGVIRSSVKLYNLKLRVFEETANSTIELVESARATILEMAGLVGLGGTAALPAALRMMPKGAVKKEDYDRDIKEARRADPKSFTDEELS